MLSIIKEAEQEIRLVSPFIKYSTLEKVLNDCKDGIELKILTRWDIIELASGVSDIEIWQLINRRVNTELWLQPTLHAKYYRGDRRGLVGSANLTGAGLGWSKNSNLEILVEIDLDLQLQNIEEKLWENSNKVDQSIYDHTKLNLPKILMPEIETLIENTQFSISFFDWRPHLRNPPELYQAYIKGLKGLSTASAEAARCDLVALVPPSRLSNEEFKAWVGSKLIQHPEIQAIKKFAREPRRFGEMRSFLIQRGCQDGERQWQTWMRWLAYYLPDDFRFSTPNISEIFQAIN